MANRLVDLHRAAPADGTSSQREVVLTSDMKRESPYGFKRNEFVFPEMETINKAAYWDYQRERVYVKSRHKSTRKRDRYAPPPSETEAKHHDRILTAFVLSDLQIEAESMVMARGAGPSSTFDL